MNLKQVIEARNQYKYFPLPEHGPGDFTGLRAHETSGIKGKIIRIEGGFVILQCTCGIVYYQVALAGIENPDLMQEKPYADL